jgi:hypothetical protein
MEIKKLKLDKFITLRTVNFPDRYKLPIKSSNKNPEVIIYYIKELQDVERFVDLCNSTVLPKENRTIMVYKKGRKDSVNRDAIISPFKLGKYSKFKFKVPMLCSLSEDLSAFIMCKVEM